MIFKLIIWEQVTGALCLCEDTNFNNLLEYRVALRKVFPDRVFDIYYQNRRGKLFNVLNYNGAEDIFVGLIQ